MHASGMLDGYFSGYDIKNHFENLNDWFLARYSDNHDDYNPEVYTHLHESLDYLEQNTKEPADDFWKTVSYNFEQLKGVLDGYNLAVKKEDRFELFDMFFYNSMGDMLDIVEIYNNPETRWFKLKNLTREERNIQWKTRTKCTGLVKYLKDSDDIYVSQVAWFTYGALTRVMKHFDIPLTDEFIKNKQISFSSYPGFLFSFDDFYIAQPNKLAIFETTFTNYNEDLYQYMTSNTLFDWIRIITTIRMIETGSEFRDIFKRENSGTYNNQWVIVDYKLLNQKESGADLLPGTLYICEQLPGEDNVFTEDWTTILNDEQFFGSFNLPIINDTITLSKTMENMEENDDVMWGSPYDCCRANIFKEHQDEIVDMDKMKWMMRYNDYENEPESFDEKKNAADPGASIAARYDLRDASLWGSSAVAFGNLDSKITSKSMVETGSFYVEAGPTHDDQPVANFDEMDAKGYLLPSRGVLRVWDFDWQEFVPQSSTD